MVTKQCALAPCREKQTMPQLFLPARGGYLESWQAANRTYWQSQPLGKPRQGRLVEEWCCKQSFTSLDQLFVSTPYAFFPAFFPASCLSLLLPLPHSATRPCFLEQLWKQLLGFKWIPQMLHNHPIFLQSCPLDLFTLGKRRAEKQVNSCGRKTNLFCGISACAIWRRKLNWKDKEITVPVGNSCTTPLTFLPLLSSTTCLNAHALLPAHHCTSAPTFCPGPTQCSWKISSPAIPVEEEVRCIQEAKCARRNKKPKQNWSGTQSYGPRTAKQASWCQDGNVPPSPSFRLFSAIGKKRTISYLMSGI